MPHVTKVEIDKDKKQATVTVDGTPDTAAMIAALKEEGFGASIVK